MTTYLLVGSGDCDVEELRQIAGGGVSLMPASEAKRRILSDAVGVSRHDVKNMVVREVAAEGVEIVDELFGEAYERMCLDSAGFEATRIGMVIEWALRCFDMVAVVTPASRRGSDSRHTDALAFMDDVANGCGGLRPVNCVWHRAGW